MTANVDTLLAVRHRPEWRLLGLLALGLETDEQRSAFKALVADPGLNWGHVLEWAIRHKMMCLLAEQIAALECWPSVPALVGEHLREHLRAWRHRLARYRRAAAEIASELRSRSIEAGCTKGIVLESQLYGGRGGRYFGDIDFMIRPEDGEAVTAAMRQLGFANGYIHRSTGAIEAHSRRDIIAYRLNPDHLPPFIKRVDDPVLPHIQVDFACSFTWTRSKYSVPVAEALREVGPIELPGTGGHTIPALDVEYLFLFTVLHLFREAWVSNWIGLGQDVNLIKFADVIGSWSRWRDRLASGAFREMLHRLNVVEPVAWVLAHTDRTFGLDMRGPLGLHGAVTEEFLGSSDSPAGTEPPRFGSMLNRLFADDRQQVLNP